jgi:hypothetical protein
MPDRRHISKKPDAGEHLDNAIGMLGLGIEYLEMAERQMNLAGWRRAGIGIHQAAERIRSWKAKAEQEEKLVKEQD